jgi:hypothetical protein
VSRLHVYIPRGHYIGQVRKYGHRRWNTVTGPCRTGESAMSKAGAKMRGQHRARVLFIDGSGYHEPTLVMECKR